MSIVSVIEKQRTRPPEFKGKTSKYSKESEVRSQTKTLQKYSFGKMLH